MIVVSDASPLIALLRVNRLGLLTELYGSIVIPAEVFQEVDSPGMTLPTWVKVVHVSDPSTTLSIQKVGLDIGESAAIALAVELHAALLLIDERRGRSVATRLGLNVIGTMGMLIEAKMTRHIAEVKPILSDLLHRADFRISLESYARVLEQRGE